MDSELVALQEDEQLKQEQPVAGSGFCFLQGQACWNQGATAGRVA